LTPAFAETFVAITTEQSRYAAPAAIIIILITDITTVVFLGLQTCPGDLPKHL
jgi:hypothetical protein